MKEPDKWSTEEIAGCFMIACALFVGCSLVAVCITGLVLLLER